MRRERERERERRRRERERRVTQTGLTELKWRELWGGAVLYTATGYPCIRSDVILTRGWARESQERAQGARL